MGTHLFENCNECLIVQGLKILLVATKSIGSKRRTAWSWDDRDGDNRSWRPVESDVGRKASTKSAVTGKWKFHYGLEDRRLAAGLISNNNQLGKGDELLNIEIAKAINHVHLSRVRQTEFPFLRMQRHVVKPEQGRRAV